MIIIDSLSKHLGSLRMERYLGNFNNYNKNDTPENTHEFGPVI